MKTIFLGGGCFWCLEAVYQQLSGISSIESGYMDGNVDNPTYEQVCGGDTGHAEVIKIDYDPNIVSLTKILDIFWQIHNPTTLNQQGNDIGSQYRSAVFVVDNSELELVQSSLNQAQTLWSDPIVTQISIASKFYKAENYHQDYYNQHSWQPYCQMVINPKVSKVKDLIKNAQ